MKSKIGSIAVFFLISYILAPIDIHRLINWPKCALAKFPGLAQSSCTGPSAAQILISPLERGFSISTLNFNDRD